MANLQTPLKVFVFNVGQGDHILIELPDGSYGIIDSYFELKYNPLKEPPGLTYLKEVKKLKKKIGEKIRIRFIHFSHYHLDHLKGVQQWFKWIKKNKIEVDNLLLPGTDSVKELESKLISFLSNVEVIRELLTDDPNLADKISNLQSNYSDNPIYALDRFRKYLAKKKHNIEKEPAIKKKTRKSCNIDYLCAINSVYLYDHNPPVSVHCLTCLSNLIQEFDSLVPAKILQALFSPKDKSGIKINKNDISTVLLFRFGKHVLTFGGDAEMKSLEASIERLTEVVEKGLGGNFASNFIKIFHHGAKKSSSEAIWKAFLRPDSEVHIAISAGIHESYKHPHEETFDDIENVSKALQTTPKFYATNRDHLRKQGKLPLAAVTQNKDISNTRLPLGKIKERLRKNMQITQVFLLQSEKVKKMNQALEKPIAFLGYQFEFYKKRKKVQVFELTPGTH